MKLIKLIAGAVLALQSVVASASLIDTNGSWDGSINNGWAGSGQSLFVDNTDNVLDYIVFYFHAESHGRTFNFVLSDALNGGNVLFSTNFIAGASNQININALLTGGSTVYALIDYLGFSGQTAHFSYVNGYNGGNSVFGPYGGMSDFSTLDHRFIASFSGGSHEVPEPASIALLGLGVIGFSLAKRRRKI